MQIIPAIDLKDNKCVRLSEGKDETSIVFNKNPEQQAVFFALDNLSEGEIIRWHNDDSDSWGRIKVVSSYPQGSGYCRVIFTQISKKGKIRDFKETACKDVAYDGWLFIVNRS